MVKFQLFDTGYCTHSEKTAIQGGRNIQCKFHSICALIHHPTMGYILFDTGYAERFYKSTQSFPFSIYPRITPVYHECSQSLINQIKDKKLNIEHIFISHFHADHIGGLKDFPNVQFICSEKAYSHVHNKSGISAVKQGYLPTLMPDDFSDRVKYIESYLFVELEKKYFPFTHGWDLIGDGSLIAIDLDGHAYGQMGLLIKGQNKDYFLVADACWLSQAYREYLPPHFITRILFSDTKKYLENLKKLHQLYVNNSNILILPTHCPETLKLVGQELC